MKNSSKIRQRLDLLDQLRDQMPDLYENDILMVAEELEDKAKRRNNS